MPETWLVAPAGAAPGAVPGLLTCVAVGADAGRRLGVGGGI